MDELKWNEISGRIKELRLKSKITIERLSEMIGVSTSFVGLVERGESGISIDNLFKLSQVFDVSVDYLLTGDVSLRAEKSESRFDLLNTAMCDYTDIEIGFILDLAKFLKARVTVVQEKKG